MRPPAPASGATARREGVRVDFWALIILVAASGLLLWLALLVDDVRGEVKSLNQELKLIHQAVERQHRELIAVAGGREEEAGASNAEAAGATGEAPKGE